MSVLETHVDDYLTLRRALGFKLVNDEQALRQLVAYLDDAGAETVTNALTIAWAQQPEGVQRIRCAHRLTAARGFAVYMSGIDPATEVPPQDLFAARQRRPTPFLWSREQVSQLLGATKTLSPPLRAASYEALFGLLAVSGLRVGEALALVQDDVDLTAGVITIREAKFARMRLVPLHTSATAALARYRARRDEFCPRPRSPAFLLSSVGTSLHDSCVRRTFTKLTTTIGLRTATVRPRIHDLRHSFAVHTLIHLHQHRQLAGRLPALSDYLGHVNPSATYWYLSAAPELMALAADRLDQQLLGTER